MKTTNIIINVTSVGPLVYQETASYIELPALF